MITLDEFVEMQRAHHNRITDLEYRLAKLEGLVADLGERVMAK